MPSPFSHQGTAIVRTLDGVTPALGADVFLGDGVLIAGDVVIGPGSSIWYGSVLRGDVGAIRIGARTNVQDLSMLHMSLGRSTTVIADEVTVGHRVVIHGARIGSGALIGTGAVLLDNVEIGDEALVAAGALLTPGTIVPPRTLALGHPARIVRDLEPGEWGEGRKIALRYVDRARAHASARAAE